MQYTLSPQFLMENEYAFATQVEELPDVIAVVSKNPQDVDYFEMSYQTNEMIFQLVRNSKRWLEKKLDDKNVKFFSVLSNIDGSNDRVMFLVVPRYQLHNYTEEIGWGNYSVEYTHRNEDTSGEQ